MGRFGTNIKRFEEVSSTNDVAGRLAESGAPEGTVVVARHQTAGRGRHGRTWLSPPGQGLLFSIILRPQLGVDRLGLLPLSAALALADTLTPLTDAPVRVKWPNDVLAGGRKCAGVLLESARTAGTDTAPDFVVVGIGVNVNQHEFPAPISELATSLMLETGHRLDSEAILASILEAFERRYDELRAGPERTLDDFVALLEGLNEKIQLREPANGSIIEGVLAGIATDGAILILGADGAVSAHYSGDITITTSEQV